MHSVLGNKTAASVRLFDTHSTPPLASPLLDEAPGYDYGLFMLWKKRKIKGDKADKIKPTLSAPKLSGLMICQWQKCSITLKGLRISSGGTKSRRQPLSAIGFTLLVAVCTETCLLQLAMSGGKLASVFCLSVLVQQKMGNPAKHK